MLSTTKRIGTIGELAVAKDLVQRGFDVYGSIGDCSKADLVAIHGRIVYRIQVKTVEHPVKNVVPVAGSKTTNGKRVKYDIADVDIIAVYVISENAIAYVPMALLMKKQSRSLSLRFEPPKNNNKNVTYFSEYAHLLVAQLDSAPDYESGGCRSESDRGG